MIAIDQKKRATKKISIITVCLNEKAHIEKTIQSVLNQTFREYELLIIDGGSTDGTLEIIAKYRERIDLVISEKDQGIYDAMNKGIMNACGEYLLFLNGGDYLFDRVTLQNVFEVEINAEIIYGDLLFDDTEGKVSRGEKFIARPQKKIQPFTFFYPGIPLYHPGSIIKKNLFLSYGLYSKEFKILGDYEFFLRVIAKYKVSIKYVPITFAVFNTLGIASKKDTLPLRKQERKRALKKNIPIFKYYLFLYKYLLYHFVLKKIKNGLMQIYFFKKYKKNY